jgi:glycosyltransferase involved in cell wall biosynthesis
LPVTFEHLAVRVLNVVSLGYPAGGAETHVRDLSSVLRERGHIVATLASDAGPTKERFADFSFRQVPAQGLKKIAVTLYNADARRQLRGTIAVFRPDVVLLHTLQQVTPAPLFELKRIPTVLLVHGPEIYMRSILNWSLSAQDYRLPQRRRMRDLTPGGLVHYAFYRLVCRPAYRAGFRNVDEFVAYSAYMQDLLRAEGVPASYIPLGVQLLEPQPLPPGPPVVLFVGRLELEKGVFNLLSAYKELLPALPSARLVFAGDGKDRERLMAEARDIQPPVEFLGLVSRDQLPAVYARATVVVLPSVFVEAFGKVGPEALSSGRPVIASDSGGVREWLQPGKNGLLVRPGDVAQLRTSILSLLEDQGTLARMANDAPGSVSHLSIQAHSERFEELLRQVVTRSVPSK